MRSVFLHQLGNGDDEDSQTQPLLPVPLDRAYEEIRRWMIGNTFREIIGEGSLLFG